MIGIGTMRASGLRGDNINMIKIFLKLKIEHRYCNSASYIAMKRAILDKVNDVNSHSRNKAKLIADIKDPNVIDDGYIRIYRSTVNTSSLVAAFSVHYLLPLNPNIIKEGGES